MSSYPYRCTVHVKNEREQQALLGLLATQSWMVKVHQQGAHQMAIDFAKNADWHAFEMQLTSVGRGEHALPH